MSVVSIIERAKGVTADGRLCNVRTRHIHLSSLFKAIQQSHEILLDAALASHPKLSRSSVKYALLQVLSDIHYEAGQQDEKQSNKNYADMAGVQSRKKHVRTIPIGTVAICAYGALFNPVAAVFGPLVSAISAGCPCIVFMESNPLSGRLSDLLSASLDKEAYVVLCGIESSFKAFYDSFDKLVTYSNTKASNVIQINGAKSNLVVVDQSLVSESVYRNGQRRPSAKQVALLAEVAQVVCDANKKATLSTVLVSENIAPIFKELVISTAEGKGENVVKLVQSCRSTEHIIAELEKCEVHLSSLYVFGDMRQAAYLSRYTEHKSCAINCIPFDLLTGYIPPSSDSQVKKKESASLSLEPLWSPSLFSRQSSTIVVPINGIRIFSLNMEVVRKQLSAPQPFMLRKKPKHLEFFPSGFMITAFPTLLSIVGLTTFAIFKAGMAVYKSLK